MKRPAVDYRTFRLSQLHEPQFSHLKWLLGWVFYCVAYLLTEALIPAERCRVVHCFLDDLIPFCEYFVIPYVLWYFLIAGSLLYFLFYDTQAFTNLQKYFIITQIVAVAAYIICPSRQELRPAFFIRDNLLTQTVGLLYRIDTNTGVCPSLHCAFSIAIASVWHKQRDIPPQFKTFMIFLAILICMSTVRIKQHSVLDFFAALPVCLLAEFLIFGKRRPVRLRRMPQ